MRRQKADRLWEQVDHSGGPDACWPWTGGTNNRGYGQISIGGQKFGAHSLAWILTHGPLPPETPVVRHVVCRNPPCCNPAHLKPGTRADNMLDMVADGTSTGGERNPAAKLTETGVREIHRVHAEEGLSQRALAGRFGISQQSVSDILIGRTWAHLKGAG